MVLNATYHNISAI